MRTWPLLAAILLLALPMASASGSSVQLTGPASLVAEGPATATLDITLRLDGIVCPGGADVPVDIRISETRGVRSATLTWDRVLFKLAGHEAATKPWSASAEVGVRVWGLDPAGHVEVVATYALPSSCVAVGGETSGEARHLLKIHGPPAVEEPTPRMPPPAVPKSETVLPPPPAATAEESRLRSIDLDVPPLPGPVLGAILGMFAGGAVVFVKRVRLLG
jgi:hypothetical protein